MTNKIYLPRLNYIVFELVQINVDWLENEDNYRAKQVETIYLATHPEQFRFQKIARDAIVQTDKTVFLQKFNYQPEKVRISGTFGDKPRLIAGTYMNGWSRLKQFEEIIIDKSKESFVHPSGDRFIYALNYYDFTWQKFGNIDIRSFEVSGNARMNANLPMYNCEFIIIGDLIKVNESDPLLTTLTRLIGEDGIIGTAINWVNIGLEAIQPYLTILGVGIEGLNIASNLVSQSVAFVNNLGEIQYAVQEKLF